MDYSYDIVSEQLELTDPNPNIWDLFKMFDSQFFEDTLSRNCVELTWSPRMTLTAGLCAWNPRSKFCSIKLSLPLLQLRSRRDLVETLIHEMIHGFLFVTQQDDNHESHGPKFHYHMFRINQMTGTRISVYHTFHDEVRNYQNHVWKCDGPCQNRRPFFGIVKRSMNRKPGPYDSWWKQHQETCGGTFNKISEPEAKNKPRALAQPKSNPATSNLKRSQPTSDPFSKASTSTSGADVGSGPNLPKKTKIDTRPSAVVDTSQKKISDYWSKLGSGRRLG